ncbi:MAG: methyl-accepting chemotaxis protein [Bacteroidota bacterium]
MSIHHKTIIASVLLLTIPVVLITVFTVYDVNRRAKKDIQQYEDEQFQKARLRLTNLVDVAFDLLQTEYKNTGDAESALRVLSELRYDGNEGYYWITDTSDPPKMIMHAASPQLNERIMESDFLNDADDMKSQNSYAERAKLTEKDGKAFLDYKMVKPGEKETYNKLSYARLFKPLDYVLATGIYTDSIDLAVAEKRLQVEEQVANIVWRSAAISLAVLALGLILVIRFSSKLSKAIATVRDKLVDLSKGRLVEKSNEKRTDEIGDMLNALDRQVDSTKQYLELAKSISAGNLDYSTADFEEDNLLGNELSEMRNNLQLIFSGTSDVLKKAEDDGNLSARIDLAGKQGIWLEIAESTNELLSSLSLPIEEVRQIFTEMAKGDFTVRYEKESKGDIAALAISINQSLTQISVLFDRIMGATQTVEVSTKEMLSTGEEMNTTTNEIAVAISQISSGTQTQLGKIDKVSELIEKTLQSAGDMKTKALEINAAAREGSERSTKGVAMLNDLVGSIGDIETQARITRENIDVLKTKSNQISQVLTVIAEISSQTNLLALNAAIEAAQAGEAGRGFAVVADEIRKLAEDSRNNAKQIEQLINEVQSDTNLTANAIHEMNDRVNQSTKLSKEASIVFEQILVSSENTYQVSDEITTFSQSQESSMKNVVGLTEEVVVIAEQAAAGTEEVATSSTELATGMETYKARNATLSNISSELIEELAKLKTGRVD